MNTFISLLTNMVSKSALFSLFIVLTLSLGCQQAEEQSKDEATETTTEEATPDEQKEEGDEADSKDQTSEEASGKAEQDISADSGISQTPESEDSAAADADGKTVVATVNGNPVYKRDLRAKSLDDVIENEIFYQAGLEMGYDKRFADQINDYKKRIISSAVRKEKLNKLTDSKVTDEDMKAYYKENEGKYMHLVVEQISVKDEKVAEEIREKALGGEEFKDIAKDYTDKKVDVRVKEFRLPTHYNHIFKEKKIGSLSETQKGVQGFELFRITEIQRIPFEKAKPALRHNVLSQRKAEAMSQYAQELSEKYGIEIDIKKEQQK